MTHEGHKLMASMLGLSVAKPLFIYIGVSIVGCEYGSRKMV